MYGEGADDLGGGEAGRDEVGLVGVPLEVDSRVPDADLIEGADAVTEEEFVRIRKRRIERLLEVYEASALALRHELRHKYQAYLGGVVGDADPVAVASALSAVAKRKRKAKRHPMAPLRDGRAGSETGGD